MPNTKSTSEPSSPQPYRRRLRSDRPVLAELSGGMDSSSIVCMADIVMTGGDLSTPRLDTISYYDDSIPGLDERLYVNKWNKREVAPATTSISAHHD